MHFLKKMGMDLGGGGSICMFCIYQIDMCLLDRD